MLMLEINKPTTVNALAEQWTDEGHIHLFINVNIYIPIYQIYCIIMTVKCV